MPYQYSHTYECYQSSGDRSDWYRVTIGLASALQWEAQDEEDAVAGIQRGLDDFEAGRFRSFDEFAAEQRHISTL